MRKQPGVFRLLATAFTGFGTHLLTLCTGARDRLFSREDARRRPRKR
jgi:hypothetical protein